MNSASLKILLIEDNPGDTRLIQEMLTEAGGFDFNLNHVNRLSMGLDLLAKDVFDLVLLDLSLPDSLGIDTFIRIHSEVPKMPIIVLSSLDDESIAVKAVREGAQDYLVKGEVDGKLLVRAISYAIERNNTEEALRDSEERYRTTIDSMGDAIHVVNTDLQIILFNKSFKKWNKMIGLPTEVIGKTVFDVFPFLPDKVRSEYQKVLETGKPLITEEKTCIGEQEFITETRKIPVFEANRITKIITILRDITNFRKAEEALKLSEEKYSNLFRYSNDGIILHDLNGNIIDFNQKALSQLGYTASEMLSLKIGDLHPIESIQKSEYAFKEIAKEGFVRFEIDFKKKNGEIFPAEVSSSLFEVGGKKIIQGIIRDIAERKNAEKALRISEAKFRALSENSPNMIFINKGGKVVYANKKCEEIMEYKKEEFYAPDFDYLTLIAPEFRDLIEENFRKHMRGEEILPFEFINITRSGKRIESLLTSKLIDYEGETALLGIVTDITKLKEAERILMRDKETFERLVDERTNELVQIQKKLSDAKRLTEIGALAATVAHELRNPLGVIRTACYNIKIKSQNPSLEKHLKNIERQVLESNQIINNLLFYSRIKILNFESINIYEILDEVATISEERFQKKNIFIHRQFNLLKNLVIEADPLLTKEMFINILNNAYDALTENNGSIEIEGQCDGNDYIRLDFKDNGAGIKREDLERVFEPFFSTKSKGTGLGLMVCKEIVNLHGGKIGIESEKGIGTTVTLSLPIKRKNNNKLSQNL